MVTHAAGGVLPALEWPSLIIVLSSVVVCTERTPFLSPQLSLHLPKVVSLIGDSLDGAVQSIDP